MMFVKVNILMYNRETEILELFRKLLGVLHG